MDTFQSVLNEQGALNGIGLGVGGSAGIAVSYGSIGSTNSGYVPIVQTPNQPNSDLSVSIRVNANKTEGTTVYVNGQNTYQEIQTVLYYSISQILNEGSKVITVQNSQGYNSNETYIIDVVNNPIYQDSLIGSNLNINVYDSLIQYQNRELFNYNNYLNPAQNANLVYSTVPAYTIRIKKFINNVEQTYVNTLDTDRIIDFNLFKSEEIISDIPILDITIKKIQVNVFVSGPDNSVSFIKSNPTTSVVEEIILKSGNNLIEDELNPQNVFSIQTANISTYIVKSIGVSSETLTLQQLDAETNTESITTSIQADGNYTINVVSEQFVIVQNPIPSVSFLNETQINSDEFKNYNINGNVDVPIGLLLTNTEKITIYVNNQIFVYTEFTNPLNVVSNNLEADTFRQSILTIPSKAFTNIGKYEIKIVPTNQFGDGDILETIITAVDDVWVGVPDLRNITYPSVLRGPDYVGVDVDFNISYDSVDTDFVRLYVGSINGQYTQLPNNGTHLLNVKNLLQLGSISVLETTDLITLPLILVPYNTSGRQVVTGKEEILSINFDKGNLTIPRDVAISRIAEGFISQFDTSIFDDEISKYLTHLLHLGGGDNKVITTWEGDGDSLILKLYEPLPTSVQPNQQVWISKMQSNPIVETINISGVDTSFCPPLKGPNFLLEPDNGIGFQIFDELIASGSHTSTDIFNKLTEQTAIDTIKLNIQYVDNSLYNWGAFVHFGSALERVENFYYKIQLLQQYQEKYISLVQSSFPIGYVLTEDNGGGGTPEIEGNEIIISEDGLSELQYEVPQVIPAPYAQIEADIIADKINNLIKGFDGFEDFLFKSEDMLAYPKENFFDYKTSLTYRVLKPITTNDVKGWYANAQNLSEYYDKYNSYAIKNNVPEYIFENYENADYILFLDMIGQHFDILWCYINGLKTLRNVEHKQESGLPDKLVSHLLQSMGWENKKAFNSTLLWEYMFGTTREGAQKYGRSLEDANNEVWRRILNNLPYLLKHKGTGRAMKAVMACYGVPQSMLTIMEFGGPQDPTKGGSTKFTFDDRTAAINLQKGSFIKVPWKYNNASLNYPNAIEFRIKPSELSTNIQTLVSGSEWKLDLVKTTGSFAKLELNFGGDVSEATYVAEPFISASVSTYYFDTSSDYPYAYGPDFKTGSLGFPVSTENYSNIIINRYDYSNTTSQYEVWLATSDGTRITTFVSMSLLTNDTQWTDGSFINIGSDTFSGNLDEVRLWTVPLQKSKFENHTLFPDAINGNSYTASTSDLLFRLDFEYPKDRNLDPNIKNVSISDNYDEEFAFAQNFPTNNGLPNTNANYIDYTKYPYHYTPYDRTVTANVPSLGFNTSNKIRFEEQTLVTDLSHKVRATQKSFDRAPIDSNRLGLFFSPIKELNMDILKAFGDFNIDNYIGDPSDEYKDSYKKLDVLRHYYFERLDRNIYEYIQLVRYIDKSLFEVLADLAPARANISKGLLIEPHYLERSKTRWDKPIGNKNDYESTININNTNDIELSYEVKNAELDIANVTTLDGTKHDFDANLNVDDAVQLESAKASYESEIDYFDITVIEANAPFYDAFIQIPTGSTLTGEADVFTSTQIGMDKNSLANLGYGLYARNGNAIYRTFDGLFGNQEATGSRISAFLVKETKSKNKKTQTSGYPTTTSGPVIYTMVTTTEDKYYVSILPFSGSISIGNDIVQVTPINGYLPTHYKFVNNLGEGMQRSFWGGSKQGIINGILTTPDGLPAVETFTTNPNILRVAKTGRGSGEPILEVD
jgi:hypothetical protein